VPLERRRHLSGYDPALTLECPDSLITAHQNWLFHCGARRRRHGQPPNLWRSHTKEVRARPSQGRQSPLPNLTAELTPGFRHARRGPILKGDNRAKTAKKPWWAVKPLNRRETAKAPELPQALITKIRRYSRVECLWDPRCWRTYDHWILNVRVYHMVVHIVHMQKERGLDCRGGDLARELAFRRMYLPHPFDRGQVQRDRDVKKWVLEQAIYDGLQEYPKLGGLKNRDHDTMVQMKDLSETSSVELQAGRSPLFY